MQTENTCYSRTFEMLGDHVYTNQLALMASNVTYGAPSRLNVSAIYINNHGFREL
jgi:hypothetical protein